jgi:hypothetical protein
VPHTLVGEHVMVRLTDTTAECFFKGRRVAAVTGNQAASFS